jgi:L-fuculose-phosphate aldolase
MDDGALRTAMIGAGTRLRAGGLVVAAEGNLSARLADGRLLVTPSGRRKDELTVDDVLVVDPGADPSPGSDGPRPSSDLAIHLAIYAARDDVAAIAHAHSRAAMALTVAGHAPDPALLPETAFHLSSLPVIPFAPMGSDELAVAVAEALTATEPPPRAVVLERHGAIAVGSSIDEAVDRLELVDVLCRVSRDALLVRAAKRTLGLD